MLGLVVALSVAAPLASAGASTSAGANDKPEAVATLKIENPKVEVKKKGADDFNEAKDGQELRVGDTVRTDAAGLAEIDYDADTYTRLDVSTTFKIVKLTDDQGNRQVEGTVDGGQTWNRTTALTESETFKQTGAGATAAVTGTAYAVQCNADATHCDWIGIVDAFTLTGTDGAQKLVSPLDQCDSNAGVLCADITKLDPSELGDWIIENLFKDVARGFPLPDFLQNATIVVDQGTGEAFLVPAQPASQPPVFNTIYPITILSQDEHPGYPAVPGAATKLIAGDEQKDTRFTINVNGATFLVFTSLTNLNGSGGPSPTNIGTICAPGGSSESTCGAGGAAGYTPVTIGQQYQADIQFSFYAEEYEDPGSVTGSFTVEATNGDGTTSQTVPVEVYESTSEGS